MAPRILPADLLPLQPELARLVNARFARLTAKARTKLLRRAAREERPLPTLWAGTGCPARYGYAVALGDLVGGDSAGVPVQGSVQLSDAAVPVLELGARGAARLLATLAWALTDVRWGRNPPSAVVQVVRQHGRLDYAPDPAGLFRGARLIAVARAGNAESTRVEPEDLVVALAMSMTPSLYAALAAAGVATEPLEDLREQWSTLLGRTGLDRLRLTLVIPPPLVQVPSSWRIDDVAPAGGLTLRLPDAAGLLPELDSRWLASEYLRHATLEGVPPVRPLMGRRPVGVRTLVDRRGSDGWSGLFAAALADLGWDQTPSSRGNVRLLLSGDAWTAASPGAASAPEPPESDPNAGFADARAEFAAVHAELAATLIGDELINRLAVIAWLHRRGLRGQVVLLTGPTGSGKSFAARQLAQASGAAVYVTDASGLVETGWRGVSVPELLGAMYRASGQRLEVLERMALVLNEVDKTRVTPGADGVSADKRFGQQACTMALASGEQITVEGAGGAEFSVSTEGMLLILTGAFSDAPWHDVRAPTSKELISYGLLAEYCDRLRERIFIAPRSTTELVRMYTHGVEGVEAALAPAFGAVGCQFRISQEACLRAARLVAAGHGGAGPRTGRELLMAAGRRLLLRALSEPAPPGTLYVVAPDDLDLPQPSRRRRW